MSEYVPKNPFDVLLIYDTSKYINLSRGDPYDDPPVIPQRAFADFYLNFVLPLAEANHEHHITEVPEELLKKYWSAFVGGKAEYPELSVSYLNTIKKIVCSESNDSSCFWNLLRELATYAQGGDYTNPQGMGSLVSHDVGYEGIVQYIFEKIRKIPVNPHDAVIMTNGATEAISLLFSTLNKIGFLKKGDEIITVEPLYSPYLLKIFGEGYKTLPLLADPELDWQISDEAIDNLEEHISERTKAMIMVNPGNPTSTILKEKTIDRLAKLADDLNILVISDIVYSQLCVQGDPHFISRHESLQNQLITIDSTSKLFQDPGDRGGIILSKVDQEFLSQHIGDLSKLQKKYRMREADGLGRILTLEKNAYNKNAPASVQVKHLFYWTWFIKEPKSLRKRVIEDARKYEEFFSALGLPKRNNFVPYYRFVKISDLTSERPVPKSDEFVRKTAEKGVLLLPGYFFSDPKLGEQYVRICVANSSEEKLKKALELLKK